MIVQGINYSDYQQMQNQEAGDEHQNELMQLTDTLLDKSMKNSPQVKESLSSLFDLLLWSQKRKEAILENVIESKLLIIIQQKYKELVDVLISGYILLLGNAKDDGKLILHLLQNRLPDQLLLLYLRYLSLQPDLEEDEHLHLLGSYLKAYHRHLNPNTLPYFIHQQNCALIYVCCSFFNCPEEITRTSIMNILMNILKFPFASQLLTYPGVRRTIKQWCLNMCRLLRNQLKDFDQNLLTTEEAEGEYIINLINDKIILWEDLSALNEHLFSESFYEEIIVPLVVGSLNTSGIPLFTLKFALFILNKLVKTIANLDLANQLGSLLFLSREVVYRDSQLGTSSLKPFSLHRIGEEVGGGQEEYELNEFKQVNQLFMNILRSKDSRFLECICLLVISLLSEVRKSPKQLSFYIKSLGFGLNGFSTMALSEILINQFNALHSLDITRLVCSLLAFLQPTKYLSDELKYRFLHLYRNSLEESLRSMDKCREGYDYICEVFEYDARTIAGLSFQADPKSDSDLIFNNQIIENEAQPFYQQLPETDRGLLRYALVKTLLLRRLATQLIEECSADRSLERYLQKARVLEAKYIKPGQYLKLPITCSSYRCKLLDEKIEIPGCMLLEDENNLIIGYVENMQVKIIINIKLKHASPCFKVKKDKIYAEIDIRKYDSQKTEDLVELKGVVVKNLEVGAEYFRVKKGKLKEKEMASIAEILRNARASIPEISLI